LKGGHPAAEHRIQRVICILFFNAWDSRYACNQF